MTKASLTNAEFSTHYRQDFRIVYVYVIKMVHDEDVARDLTQDAFLRAYQRRDSFTGEASFRSWVTSIAKHVAIDYLRHRGAGFRFKDDERVKAVSGSRRINTPDEEITGRQIESKVQVFFASHLKQNSIEILFLDMEGYSNPEIAQIKGISVPNTSTSLHRIRRELTEYLEEK